MQKLPTVATGPMAGFPILNVDMARFAAYKQAAYDKGVGYEMGGKDPILGAWPIDYDNIDCSGFARAILDYSTHGQTAAYGLPDGSFLEADWFAQQGFRQVSYANVPDWGSHLLIAFHRPGGRGGDPTGHVWLLIHGHSVESYGGHGPGERSWNHQWFVDHCDEVYVLT